MISVRKEWKKKKKSYLATVRNEKKSKCFCFFFAVVIAVRSECYVRVIFGNLCINLKKYI